MDEIVSLLWQRDEQALSLLENRYSGFCRRIIAGLLDSVQDREEVLNDVWLRVWNGIQPARPKYFRAYLAKTARNTSLRYLERAQAQKRSGITVLLDELAECIPDQTTRQPLDSVQIRDLLNRFVASLRTEEREIFLQRYFFGASIQEIAAARQYSENRVSVSLHRTRNKLRDFLEREGYST